jgi:hypothetical protein
MSVALVVMGIAQLLRVLSVSSSSPTARVIAAMMVGLSSSGTGGMETSSKKARHWYFLPVFSRYASGVGHLFMSLPLLMFLF